MNAELAIDLLPLQGDCLRSTETRKAMIRRAQRPSLCAEARAKNVGEEWIRWLFGIAILVVSGAVGWLRHSQSALEARHEKKIETLEERVNEMRTKVISREELEKNIDRVLSANSANVDRLAAIYVESNRSQSIETRAQIGKLEDSVKESEKASAASRDRIGVKLEEYGRAAAVAAERSGTTEAQVERLIEQSADLSAQVGQMQLRVDAWSIHGGGPHRA